MNWLVFHIVSGSAFFTGVALVIVSALSSIRSNPFFKRFTALAFLIGVIAIVISSTAIPYWYYAFAIVVTLAWIASRYGTKRRRWAAFAVAAAWGGAALLELPYHVARPLSPSAKRSITVIGDSVTAGMGDDEKSETWPRILARQHGLHVQDLSHMGDTAATALKRARDHQLESAVVVVEIGGNDVLGSTTSARFSHDLDALLTHLAAPERQIVMFELPLPPFYHEFGRVQRTVAKQHHVTLVPKRVFLSVVAESKSTLDTIHLTQSGHQRMADCVWQLVQSAFPP